MLKRMLAVASVTMILQPAAAAPARPVPAPNALARAPAVTNAQGKVRGPRRVKARAASAASTAAAQQNAAVYIPRCYDCPM